jgi:hypothetical protein
LHRVPHARLRRKDDGGRIKRANWLAGEIARPCRTPQRNSENILACRQHGHKLAANEMIKPQPGLNRAALRTKTQSINFFR